MQRLIHFARRNKILIAATAVLMAGAGCVSAARKAGEQLTQDSLKPITVPLEVYKQGVESASGVEANERIRIEQAGGLGQ